MFELVANLCNAAWRATLGGQPTKSVTDYRDGPVWVGNESEAKKPSNGKESEIDVRDLKAFRPDWLPPSLSPDRPAE
jgi:hypothetical protein